LIITTADANEELSAVGYC